MTVVITSINDLESEGGALATGVRSHVEEGLDRLIARWADKPNVRALLTMLLEQVQELEEAIWLVIYGRMVEYAEGVQLDMLGRLVGEDRNSLSDDLYRVRIRVRIRINQSFGTSKDVIEMLRIADSAAFHLREFSIAAFSVWYDEPPSSAAVGHELAGLVAQTRAAGVSGRVTFPVDRETGRGAFFGSVAEPALNAARGFSSIYNSDIGGLFGHTARA